MHDNFERGGIFFQPDMDIILNEQQATLMLAGAAVQNVILSANNIVVVPTAAAAAGNSHSANSSPASSIGGSPVSSSSVMTSSVSSSSIMTNSLSSGQISEDPSSSDSASNASDEEDISSDSGSSDSIIDLKLPVKKPNMDFATVHVPPMASKVAAIVGRKSPAILEIEASFVRGRALNKIVEIEEMKEKAEKLSEIKFKDDEEERSEDSAEEHVEMDVFLGVLEEKKVAPVPASMWNGGSSSQAVDWQNNPEYRVKKYTGSMDEEQFTEWRKQFKKPRQYSSVSGEAEISKRKRGPSDEDELEQSTNGGKKRGKILE